MPVTDGHLAVIGASTIISIQQRIADNGYAIVDGIANTDSHIQLARCFGKLEKNALGTFVHMLMVKHETEAQPKSLSALYGQGAFPFHTDTASWPIPIRLMSMRGVRGDLRRSTRIIKSSELLSGIPEAALWNARWVVKNGRKSFYTALRWFDRCMVEPRYRLDLGCMKPANNAGRVLEIELKDRCTSSIGFDVEWKEGRVLILNNWRMMHARAGSVPNEGERLLERIYIS